MNNYNFKEIEKKWQKKWEEKKCFEVKTNSKKSKFYNLEMFPYPSGEGLHMGHTLNYTIGDIRARFKRMNKFNVLYPMGFDSFGLPAENAAIKAKVHPKEYTKKAIQNFIKQQKALGLSYDWSKILSSCEPGYYKWNQFWFLKLLEKGLVYRKKAPVNWCPECNTVLANEQVHNGKCWRHTKTDVEIKHLEQWFIKTTKYADELLNVDSLKWPERIKTMQKNWIGKSFGTEIIFEIETPTHKESKKTTLPVFTTRPDTLFGVTFMVISAQHPNLMNFVNSKQEKEVKNFLKKLNNVSEKNTDILEKEGVFTGSYAINPITKDKVPIYTGNFVVADYGSGIVMAVPAHDQRDFEFAKKYGLDIKQVISGGEIKNKAYTGPGKLINSNEFNKLDNNTAKEEITKYLIKNKLGKKTTQYKLKDWLVSRQRYWGTPIPVIYCNKCGIVPVPEKELPIKLPDKVEFGKGNPLLTNKEFVNTKCPKCNSSAKRETDTMDTFFDSSWYYMRYPDNKNNKKPFEDKIENYWLPVDTYIGGAEHACMHLLYARFFTKALKDLGFINYNEPFTQLFNQGMLHAEDGRKMSKSLGNVINPLDMINSNGADSLRLTLMSFASPDSDTNWNEKVLQGNEKFLKKVYETFEKVKIRKSTPKIESKLNKTIKEITNDIENFKYNLGIIKIRNLFDSLGEQESKETLEKSLQLLHPFCPHITEELWEKLGHKNFISLSEWPKADESKINKKFEEQDQAIEKLINDINNISKLITDKLRTSSSQVPEKSGTKENKFSKIYVYVLPNEKEIYSENINEIKKRTNENLILYAVNDKDKYDPENKSKKVKPGRPGIYFE